MNYRTRRRSERRRASDRKDEKNDDREIESSRPSDEEKRAREMITKVRASQDPDCRGVQNERSPRSRSANSRWRVESEQEVEVGTSRAMRGRHDAKMCKSSAGCVLFVCRWRVNSEGHSF